MGRQISLCNILFGSVHQVNHTQNARGFGFTPCLLFFWMSRYLVRSVLNQSNWITDHGKHWVAKFYNKIELNFSKNRTEPTKIVKFGWFDSQIIELNYKL